MKKFVLIAASFAALVTLGGATNQASAQAECPCFTLEDVREIVTACDANDTPAVCAFDNYPGYPRNAIGCNLVPVIGEQPADTYSAHVTIMSYNNADYSCAYMPGGEGNEWDPQFFEGTEGGEACLDILEQVAAETGC